MLSVSALYDRKEDVLLVSTVNLHKGISIKITTPRIHSFAVGFYMNLSCASYFLSKNLVYGWRNRYVLEHQISAMEKRLLGSHIYSVCTRPLGQPQGDTQG